MTCYFPRLNYQLTFVLDFIGNPQRNLIITLPPIESRTVEVIFSKAERRLYTSLLNRSQEVFGGYLKNGTARKSWFAIFSLLARLRQVCDHVSLIVKNKKVNEESIKDKIANTEMMDVKNNDDERGIDEKVRCPFKKKKIRLFIFSMRL